MKQRKTVWLLRKQEKLKGIFEKKIYSELYDL